MIIVYCEHDNQQLSTATKNALTAAAELGEVHALVMGHNCQSVAQEVATLQGVSKVLLSEDEQFAHPVTEVIAPVILTAMEGASALVAAHTSFARGLLPWIAAKLDIDPISDVIQLQIDGNHLKCKRPIYAGSALLTIECTQQKKVLSIRPTAFSPASVGEVSVPIEMLSAQAGVSKTQFISCHSGGGDRPDLSSAERVVSGGRGMGSKENFALLEQLADKLGAAVGASRAAVDAGFIANEFQVGQTGKLVAPQLYIAVGISGAIQHLAGMKDSGVIVAINQDADAPIFSIATYGLVGDLFTIVPELIENIQQS